MREELKKGIGIDAFLLISNLKRDSFPDVGHIPIQTRGLLYCTNPARREETSWREHGFALLVL
jgi:hypothetical protein